MHETTPVRVPNDLVYDLRYGARHPTAVDIQDRAANEIIALESEIAELRLARKERDVAMATLGTYKRAYVRAKCAPYYTSGALWKTRINPMRSDGVFVVEDCEHAYESRTVNAFPHQFERDIAEEIVELLNRATRELTAPSSILS